MTAGADLAPQFRRPLGRATLGDQLRRHAINQPDKAAFVTYDAQGDRRAVTYLELDRRANRAAHALASLGVGRGDRVAVMSPNTVDVVAAYYGALKLGAAFTGVNPALGVGEVRGLLEHAEPRVVAGRRAAACRPHSRPWTGSTSRLLGLDGEDAGPRLLPGAAARSRPRREPDAEVDELDVAMLVYTSGTEAAPKGVLIPHRNYLISTAPAWSWGLRTGPDDVWLFVMPFHTIAGLGSMTTLTVMGATLVLPSTTDAGASLRYLRDEQVTVIAQTPTFYLALAQHDDFGPQTVGTVARCMTYGGQVSPRVVQAWSQAAPGLVWGTYWGQSELSQLGSVGWFSELDDIPDHDPTWIGRPVTHLETRVVGPDGQDAEIGELWCRSPSVMLGYYKDPERTAEVMRDGWLHTGDIVRIDAERNLFFYDRLKDVIKTGGYERVLAGGRAGTAPAPSGAARGGGGCARRLLVGARDRLRDPRRRRRTGSVGAHRVLP